MTDAIDVVGVVVNRPIRIMLEMIVESRLWKFFGRRNVVCHFCPRLVARIGSGCVVGAFVQQVARQKITPRKYSLLLPGARYCPAVDRADQLPSPAQGGCGSLRSVRRHLGSDRYRRNLPVAVRSGESPFTNRFCRPSPSCDESRWFAEFTTYDC